MKLNLSVLFVLSTSALFAQRPAMVETPDTNIYYKLAADAIPQEGVPKGEIRGPFTLPSQAYPGHAAHVLGLRAGAVRRRRFRPA